MADLVGDYLVAHINDTLLEKLPEMVDSVMSCLHENEGLLSTASAAGKDVRTARCLTWQRLARLTQIYRIMDGLCE